MHLLTPSLRVKAVLTILYIIILSILVIDEPVKTIPLFIIAGVCWSIANYLWVRIHQFFTDYFNLHFMVPSKVYLLKY